jgi:hypothetical protein
MKKKVLPPGRARRASGGRAAGVVGSVRMKKREIAERVARQTGLPPGVAADEVDQAVHRILAKLRAGKPAKVPGLGKVELRRAVRSTGGRRG